jgi:hypothetical protein
MLHLNAVSLLFVFSCLIDVLFYFCRAQTGKTMADLVKEAVKTKTPMSDDTVESGIRTALSATFSRQSSLQRMDQVSFVCIAINLFKLYSARKNTDDNCTVSAFLEHLKTDCADLWQRMSKTSSEQGVKNMLAFGGFTVLVGPMVVQSQFYQHFKLRIPANILNKAYLYASTLTTPGMQRYYIAYMRKAGKSTPMLMLKDADGSTLPEGPPPPPLITGSQPCVFLWQQDVFMTRAYALYRAAQLKPIVQQVADTVSNDEIVDPTLKGKLLNNPEAFFSTQLTKVSRLFGISWL